jgi:Cu(I)/Ag(I) efflux system membrane fusion protein/cobalt-zinc-cadmium efflux system membrane fusion protein
MDLVPVREQTEEAKSAEMQQEPSGLFSLGAERQQLIGVRFTEVSQQQLERRIRTVGRVELDQQRIAEVHPKITGWIEEAFVNYQWQHVRKGEPLFSIYSPQLVAAQEEYLLALKAQEQLAGDNPFPKAVTGARSLVEDARRRLQLWDVTNKQIQELEQTKHVQRTLIVYAPISGHVTERNAFPQQQVTPAMNLYTIADHSRVWVHVDLYENEIGLVRLGQRATMTVPAYPGRMFAGRVTFIWPHLDMSTRTLKVRLEFNNSDLTLKPEMYADVELRIPLGRRLAVPKSAVLPTGARNLVFVDRGEGRMEIRQVELGVETDEFYEIRRGLALNDRVVTAANFLVDAESQVQGAIATWQTQEPKTKRRMAPTAERTPQGLEFSAEFREPRQFKVGKNSLRLVARDPTGQPVESAEIEVALFMPAMGTMQPMASKAILQHLGNGEYGGEIEFPMAGTWQTTVVIKKEGHVLATVRTTLMAR